MRILGIETSCDETAAAVVEKGRKILSNIIASSVELHKKYGGIIPEIAARQQVKCILPVIEEAVEKCKLKIEDLDAIAVTVGPGLIGSLLVGVEAAKTLSFVLKKPIVPVNHLLAHLYAVFLNSKLEIRNSKLFPLIGLIASGGHTELVLLKEHGDYTFLGGTRDDAAGECFDKCARILGLGYPGGPEIEKTASLAPHPSFIIHLPRPMLDQDNFDFSFSGLKTAVFQITKNKKQKTKNFIVQMAGEIQEAITDVLVQKTIRAARKYKVKNIIVAGGVAANKRLREKFELRIANCELRIKLFFPPPKLCTDNAAMVASFAFFNFKPVRWQKIQANPNL